MKVHIFHDTRWGKQYLELLDGTPAVWDSIELALLQIEALYNCRSFWSAPPLVTWQLELG